MELQAPQILEAARENCPEDASPIFYVDILYNIFRGKTRLPYKAERRVIKGTDFRSEAIKINALKSHFGYERDKTQFKKIVAFDLSKIEIRGIVFKKSLGYGIKSS